MGYNGAAQHKEIAFKHLSTIDGLSNFTVFSIAQDHQGFMWFGTMDGLNRFDGKHIKTYREDPDDLNSIGNNFIYSLQISSDSGLWVGTNRGLYYYDFYYNSFSSIPIVDSTGNNNVNIIIRSLLLDENWLWIGTNKGLFKYDLTENKFPQFDRDVDKGDQPAGTVYALYKSQDGIIWIGSDQGLTRYDNGIFSKIDLNKNSKRDIPEIVISIISDKKGRIWLGTQGLQTGIIIYDPIKKTVEELNESNGHLPYNRVNCLYRFENGNIWAGTTWGLSIIDPKTYESNFIVHRRHDPGSISQNSIKYIYQDQNGLIWISTYSGGVNYFDAKSQKITSFTHNSDDENSLNYNIVSCIFEDGQNDLWIGTEYGGVNIFSNTDKTFKVLKKETDQNSLINDNVKSIIEDQRGRKFIATQFGLSIYNPTDNSFVNISDQLSSRGSLDYRIVHDLCQDKYGNIWIGTIGERGHFQMYDLLKDTILHFYPEKRNFPTLYSVGVNSMVYDETRDIVWAGGNNGLAGFNIESKKYVTDDALLPAASTFQDIIINDLFLDNNGILWIATFGRGLFIMDVETFQLRRIGRNEGLFESSFYALISDDDGNIWASVSASLLKIKALDSFKNPIIHVEKFGIQEGFPPQQYFRTATYKGDDGTLYFGGDNGFISFNPREVENIVFHPAVAILDIHVDGKSLEIESKTKDRYLNVASMKEVSLTYNQSSFAVQFIAPNFINPDNTWYQYQLFGSHDSWQKLENANAINFSELKPGNYELRLRASSDPDSFAEDFTAINIEINPPYWGTPLAYFIYVIIILVLLYAFYTTSRNWERLSQNLRFEHLEREKEHEFHLKRIKFFTDISHELRTPLTLILAPLERIVQSNFGSAKIKNQLMLMLRNGDRMLQLINQLLDLRKLETGHMQLKAAKGNISNFIKEVSLSFRELAQHRNIEFTVESSQHNIDVWFDRDKFEIILFNLFSNALKFTQDKGKVSVFVELVNDEYPDHSLENKNSPGAKGSIRIRIENTGLGIPADQIEHIFERFYTGQIVKEPMKYSSGVGLEIVKNLVDLHKGEVSAKSCYDENGINRRTCFTIILKKGKEHFTKDELLETYKSSEDISNYRKPITLIEIEKPVGDKEYPVCSIIEPKEEFILIVEDNHEVRKLVADIFRDEYNILEAVNGDEGLDIARDKIPNLIISDIMMPGIDGIELCRRIKTDINTSHIPVILLTARTAVTFKYEGLETGADDYIVKPFSVENLRLRSKNLIKQRKLLKEHFTQPGSILSAEITLTSVDEKLMQKTIDYILEHLSDSDLTVDKIAKEIGMSRANFYRKTKALTNMSASEFLRKVRMDHAAQLLKTNKFRVSEVQSMVGISDADYFRKCFKEHFDLAPKAYIESQGK